MNELHYSGFSVRNLYKDVLPSDKVSSNKKFILRKHICL